MVLHGLKILLFLIIISAAQQSGADENLCRPFQAYPKAPLPPPPSISVPPNLPPRWEENLVGEISSVKTQEEFSRVYKLWLEENPKILSDKKRYRWLRCIQHYVTLDSTGDGRADWTAIIDDRPSFILYPTKILDLKLSLGSKNIPSDLKFDNQKRKEAANFQNELYKSFNVLALDNTDKHAPEVLKDFLMLYKYGFPTGIQESLKNIRYLYAFAGHDPRGNSAAYHDVAHAISVAGLRSYQKSVSLPERVHLFGALAHEMGHAFIFQNLSPTELLKVARRFGGWSSLENKSHESFYDQAFFLPRILKSSSLISLKNYKSNNITSEYAMTNIHEWFAEAFAATALIRMGQAHLFGPNWRQLLIKNPENSGEYWSNYNNLSPEFVNWLHSKIKKGSRS